MRLYDILRQYSDKSHPYHMPGHKRSPDFDYLRGMAALDFTEIDGLDNLHAPEGILAQAQANAAEVFGSDRAFFLVNGSTGGILAAIHAVCGGHNVCGGRPLILARNCHKSVSNAAALCHAQPHWLLPRSHPLGFCLDVTPDGMESAILAHPDAACAVITSPTYDGVVSDIRGIASVCHRHGIPLIVDAAHGAHLGFLDPGVPSPVTCGADVVIMSLHKTLPSLTQTALLHVSGTLVNPDAVAASLAIFETSSPSYLFMASIDGCVHLMHDAALFDSWRGHLAKLRAAYPFLIPEGIHAFDISKLLLPGSGDRLSAHLRGCGIEPEMTAANYALLMTGAGDSDEMTDALCTALTSLPPEDFFPVPSSYLTLPDAVCPPHIAQTANAVPVPLSETAGRIASDTVMAYPPGIPLIVPGERIPDSFPSTVSEMRRRGANVITGHGSFCDTILCAEIPE